MLGDLFPPNTLFQHRRRPRKNKTVPTWTDKAQALAAIGSLVVAVVSIYFVVASLRQASRALRAQNRSTDVASVITIFQILDSHWCRFRSANEDHSQSFEFGQLISYYELSCRLFRDKIFQTSAAATLYEHLHDVLTLMRADVDFKRRFDLLHSQDDNYENIFWLCSQPRKLVKRGQVPLTTDAL
jgi:hypothetical protein